MFLALIRRLLADRRGVSAILIAVMAAVIIGFASLGIEVVNALQKQRSMQSAADSAAMAAVVAAVTGYPTDYKQEGYGVAGKAGFTSGTHTCDAPNSTVYVGTPCTGDPANNLAACAPPTNPPGPTPCVEVLIRQPFTLWLAHVVFPSNFTLQARAVAVSTAANGCAAILDPTDKGSFTVGGNAAVQIVGCDMYVNSSYTPGAAVNNGGATIACSGLFTVGTATGFDPTTCPTGQSGPIADPYANVPNPAVPGTCNNVTVNAGTTTTLTATTTPICIRTLKVNGGGTLQLCPDLYVVTNSLNIVGGGTLRSLQGTNTLIPGTTTPDPTYDATFATDCPNNVATDSGVTIFLQGGATASVGSNNPGGAASFALTAPVCDPTVSSGPTACSPAGTDFVKSTGLPTGMLFFQDRTSGSACHGNSPASSFTGSSTSLLSGTLYFPTQCLNFSGGSLQTSACLSVVSYQLGINGGPSLNATLCNPFHARQIRPIVMVE